MRRLADATHRPCPNARSTSPKPTHTARHRDWKLIPSAKIPAQLYNVTADPYEKTGLATQETMGLAGLKMRLETERAKDNPALPIDLKGKAH